MFYFGKGAEKVIRGGTMSSHTGRKQCAAGRQIQVAVFGEAGVDKVKGKAKAMVSRAKQTPKGQEQMSKGGPGAKLHQRIIRGGGVVHSRLGGSVSRRNVTCHNDHSPTSATDHRYTIIVGKNYHHIFSYLELNQVQFCLPSISLAIFVFLEGRNKFNSREKSLR